MRKITKRLVGAKAPEPVSKGKLRTSMREAYEHLRDVGFRPATVIDVGVADGTFELYESFPDSKFYLVEALPQFEPVLKHILGQYAGQYILAAASAEEGTACFNLHADHAAGSSLLKETMGSRFDGHEVQVPVVTLDAVVNRDTFPPPYLMKVDVQGAELSVLEGAKSLLEDTEVVVLEVSLFEFMIDAPQLYDVINTMKKYNMVAYDIILGWNRPLDNALGQVDIVFVKEKGSLRKLHSYSAATA